MAPIIPQCIMSIFDLYINISCELLLTHLKPRNCDLPSLIHIPDFRGSVGDTAQGAFLEGIEACTGDRPKKLPSGYSVTSIHHICHYVAWILALGIAILNLISLNLVLTYPRATISIDIYRVARMVKTKETNKNRSAIR